MSQPAANLSLWRTSPPLTAVERSGIVVAVNSVFLKLQHLYARTSRIYVEFGFTQPSAGVIARDVSEKVEHAIRQHCSTFTSGRRYADLCRAGEDWEVKICGGAGLTINQSKQIGGEHYIVVNYARGTGLVRRVWVLWSAHDSHFSPRVPNSNARHLLTATARANVEVLARYAGRSLATTKE